VDETPRNADVSCDCRDDPGVSLERFFILSVAPRASRARRARDE